MFERYTETARRVIFFARYEASQLGSPAIEPEHVLLGLVREDGALLTRLLARAHDSPEAIRQEIEGRAPERAKISTAAALPLSPEAKRVLAFAHEESERLGHRHIGTEHLLLGLLREERSTAAQVLYERGLRLNAVRDEGAQSTGGYTGAPAGRRDEDLLGLFTGEMTRREMRAQTTSMGPARAAELHRYPGPAQVLGLSRELLLSGEQVARVREVYDRALGEAARLGREVNALETKLDGLFVEGGVDHDGLSAAEAEIARLRSDLRGVHLKAYVETMGELTPEQIEWFDKLRGHA